VVTPEERGTVTVRLQPRSSRPGLKGVSNGVLELRVAAPPVDGRANEEARRLLAKIFGVAKSAVRLTAGGKSRNKVFVIAGVTAGKLEETLSKAAEKT
jgi:uncharacterized protein (TIGR00251 family)